MVTVLKAGDHDLFVLRDSLKAVDVQCAFNADLEEEVRAAWKKRVRAFGKIRYTAEGIPREIEVDSIEVLKSAEQLPQFKDFSIDITGGIDSVDYIRSMRDA